MLIALYFFLANVVLPQLGAFASAIFEPVMTIIIILAGLVMLFGVVGMKVSNNLGATITNGIFRAIGYLARTLFQGIGWCIRSIARLIPRVFNGSRQTFTQMGLNPLVSNMLAALLTTIILIIII